MKMLSFTRMMVGFRVDKDLGRVGTPTGGALIREALVHLLIGVGIQARVWWAQALMCEPHRWLCREEAVAHDLMLVLEYTASGVMARRWYVILYRRS
jgi:hypothetical protein